MSYSLINGEPNTWRVLDSQGSLFPENKCESGFLISQNLRSIDGEPVIIQSEHGLAPKWKRTKRLPEIAARHRNLNQNMTNEI
jgi:hypothetical protein